MAGFLPDTSCMVPALCSWHEHHERAVREMSRRFDGGERLVVAAPALVESYSVLTRLPSPYRLSPEESLALLKANFLRDDVESIAIDAHMYRRLLERAPELGVAGGRIYDAIITACARAAGVAVILTFNERHFLPIERGEISIVVPA